MNNLEKVLNEKKTENGDIAYKSTGSNLLDILFMTEYYSKHLEEVKIGTGAKEKIFSMFIRDPRFGLGRRDLGRELMKQSKLFPDYVVKAGRFDDLWHNPTDENLRYLYKELLKNNQLAKKWMPRLVSKNKAVAKALCKEWKLTEKEYRKLIKCENTVEYKLSYAEIDKSFETELTKLFEENKYIHPLVDTINFEQVPSLAMIKYYDAFLKREDTHDRFYAYLESVKKGEKKLNISTTNVYDIYKTRDKIDADLFFDKLEKININCIPILDTSGSMWDANDSIGKAMSIAHYLSKCSTYCNGQLISFSSKPQLITIKEQNCCINNNWGRTNEISAMFGTSNRYSRELNSMFTGDCSKTSWYKVIELLSNLNDFPDYFVVLSDMEFDVGSEESTKKVFKIFDEKNIKSKIVWWNFNDHNQTVTITAEEPRCIYISGFSPYLLKYLENSFDGSRFLDALLKSYAEKVNNG